MKNTELRIGNYIASGKTFSEISSIGEVIEIGNDDRDFEQIYCQCEESFDWFFKDNYCGIPLTEEWLLKFHPNALDLSNSIFRVGRFKLIWKFAYEYWYIVDDITGCYMTKLDFVHEWQNFWHIMNGEELTINN